MNFKKTWKRFWTLSRSSEGFTLVELIVVIAILAILAGIAVPAYSGYIKKANKAADLQLLGAVNTAYAAAVMEEDVATDLKTVSGSIVLGGPEGAKTITRVGPDKYNEAFMTYYAGNTGSSFKVITNLIFVNGVFVDPTSTTEGVNTYSFGNGTIYLSDSDVNALKGSAFMTDSDLGAAVLAQKVDGLTGLAGTVIQGVFNDQAFLQSAADTLGVKVEDLADEVTKLAGENPTSADIAKVQGNAAVLYAAQNTVGKTSDDVISLLGEGKGWDTISGNISTDKGEALSQAALAYGMYTAWAHSDTGTAEAKANTATGTSPVNVMEDLDNEAFLAYLKTDAAKADAEGYLSAMNMINSCTGDPEAVKNALSNGYNNDELIGILNSAMGVTAS